MTSANGWTYKYDAIGNLESATKAGQATRTVQYSPFNTPTSIVQGANSSTIVYGPNQDRIQHSDSNGRVTNYVGGIYEEVTLNGETQKIHYVGDMALFISKGDNTSATYGYEYLHRDHVGSIVARSKGTVNSALDVDWQANGAWGERRYQQWNGPLDNLLIPSSTARGFTDHEHLDAVGLIHMNGRVYDPELGRFLSADPFVQAPYNTQSYNRYSYVFNNPLSFTDPSGYQTCGDPGPTAPGGTTMPCGKTVEELKKEQQDAEDRRDAMWNSYVETLKFNLDQWQSSFNQQINSGLFDVTNQAFLEVRGYGLILSSPVLGATISSEYNATRTCPVCSSTHRGTDYSVKIGTIVVATYSGRVVFSGKNGDYGKLVIINHGPANNGKGNLYSMLAHGSALSVKAGDNIKTGQEIMKSGSTGNSTAPHVHYEIITSKNGPDATSGYFSRHDSRYSPSEFQSLLSL